MASGGAGPGLLARGRRPDLGGAQGVRVLRLLQGARGGLRPADLPLGVAEDPPPRGLPRRRAHPRPGHVPQAAHPRRRPLVRHRRCSAWTSTPPPAPTASSGSSADATMPRRASCDPDPSPTPPAHPDLPDCAGGRTASGSRSPTSRGSATPRSPGSSPGSPTPTSADFWNRARVSRPVVERLVLAGGFDSLYGMGSAARRVGAAGSPGATCCCTSPSSTGGPVGRGPRPGGMRHGGLGGRRRCRPPAGRGERGAPVTDQAALAAAHPGRRTRSWPSSQACQAVPARSGTPTSRRWPRPSPRRPRRSGSRPAHPAHPRPRRPPAARPRQPACPR